jgi:excisionase family DNA binding protein
LLKQLGMIWQADTLLSRRKEYGALRTYANSLLWLLWGAGKRGRKRSNTPTGDVLTPPQVARQLSVDASTVIGWIRSGELKGSNIGKGSQRPRYRIQQSDLEAFLKSRQPEARTGRKRRTKEPAGEIEFFT